MIARLALALALVATLWGQMPAARADDAPEATDRPRLELNAEGDSWLLSDDFNVPLTPALEEAVRRGVPLYFVLEFELVRPRWWWTDERLAERSIVFRLAYHALTRQFRLGFDGLTQTFDSLDEATRTMASVRNWRVADVSRVPRGTSYEARVRLRLDASQLPKPFQVNAITNRDWNPQSEWKRFTFTPQTPKNGQ
ncbi:MAG TPA: DUF4390 domain-containing protein [Burkholderiaceae bacterium]|nr:DUF4390 domain-containing protein [Burkholderiaceae bacterium]HRA77369.1 DUF4390 domain-containing protein [Burkholderiaceae bacterium]